MGELTFLRFLAGEIGYHLAVDFWEGPLDGVHDFNNRGISVEVKTVLGTNILIHVSHLSQLDELGLKCLPWRDCAFERGRMENQSQI